MTEIVLGEAKVGHFSWVTTVSIEDSLFYRTRIPEQVYESVLVSCCDSVLIRRSGKSLNARLVRSLLVHSLHWPADGASPCKPLFISQSMTSVSLSLACEYFKERQLLITLNHKQLVWNWKVHLLDRSCTAFHPLDDLELVVDVMNSDHHVISTHRQH